MKRLGKVAIVNAPTIGLFDLVAAKAKGFIDFQDIGNLTRSELNSLFKILIEFKKQNHFRGVWSSVPQSVEFMEKDGVVVESMFSPGVAALNGKGIPCIYAAPKRISHWHGVCVCPRELQVKQKMLLMIYELVAFRLAEHSCRQGYYISTPQLSKPHLTEDEWGYWYEGKTNKSDLKILGEIAVKAGISGRVALMKIVSIT